MSYLRQKRNVLKKIVKLTAGRGESKIPCLALCSIPSSSGCLTSHSRHKDENKERWKMWTLQGWMSAVWQWWCHSSLMTSRGLVTQKETPSSSWVVTYYLMHWCIFNSFFFYFYIMGFKCLTVHQFDIKIMVMLELIHDKMQQSCNVLCYSLLVYWQFKV